jgi:hypothetical protein
MIRFAAKLGHDNAGLPVWSSVDVFAVDIETAFFIFAAFHGLEVFQIEPVESYSNYNLFTYNLN